MKNRLRAALAICCVALLAMACGEEPTTPVDYGQGLFQFQLPGNWQAGGQAGKAIYYSNVENPEIRVSVEAEIQNWNSGPLTQRQLRSALGSRFNRRYGNTQSVVTYEGLAMITFMNNDDGARHWVVAKPYSIGYVQYADVGLQVPASYSPEDAQALVDKIQPLVGDAKFRE